VTAPRVRERPAASRPHRGERSGRLVLQRSPEERLALERRSFGPGITGPLALACFYLLGGLLSLAALLVPGWEGLDVRGVVTVGLATGASGMMVLVLRRYLSTSSCHVLVALGSLLIGASMVAGGGAAPTATFGVFYVWVAVYAALFFPPLPALAQVSWAGTVHVVALVLVDEPFLPSQTVVLFGTAAGTALVVGALVRQIRVVAATDELTGLANRRTFDEHVRRELARASRTERPLALLALDLDGFKQVNDTQGHAAGDRLLVASSRAWERVLRDSELLARSGGDEFLVLLPETDAAGAAPVVDRLERATPEPLGVSIGVAVAAPGDSADQLLRRADRDLYRRKSQRR
jgi:diguanylate cyclase (GGDEF)-like protein